MDAAQKLLIGSQPRRQRLGSFKFSSHELVHLVVCWHVLPLEARAVAHHGHNCGGVGTLESGQHRSLAAPGSNHQAGLVGCGNIRVAGLNKCLSSYVTFFSVGIGGNYAHLLLITGFLYHRVFR